MANYIVPEEKLTSIANSIRLKTGKSNGLTVDVMPREIESISGGGGGVTPVRIITDGRLSYKNPGAYGTVDLTGKLDGFDVILLTARVNYNGKDYEGYYGFWVKSLPDVSAQPIQFSIPLHTTLTMNINQQQLKSTYYSGSWEDIFADIDGVSFGGSEDPNFTKLNLRIVTYEEV